MEKMLRRSGYRVMVDGEERAQVAARHWGDAASIIYYRGSDDEEWEPTPFQVANARHSPSTAVLMIDEWLDRNFDQAFLDVGEQFELVSLEDEDDEEAATA